MKRFVAAPILVLAVLLAACGANPPVIDETPTAPTSVTATPGPGYITVQWQDNSDSEEGFVIYREMIVSDSVSTQAEEQVGEVPADTEVFVDRSIEPGEQYMYGVAAKGADSSSATAEGATSVSVEPGIDLSVGTYNFAPIFPDPQTALAFYFFLTESENPSDAITVSITGPAGWNNGSDYQVLIPADRVAFGWTWTGAFIPVVAGDYTMSVTINGTAYSATASTGAVGLLETVQNPTVDSAGPSSAEFSWEAVLGAQSYGATVYDAPLRVGVNAFGGETTTETTVVVDGLNLPSGEYFAGVFAFPIDRTLVKPLKPAEFNVSLAVTDTFLVP